VFVRERESRYTKVVEVVEMQIVLMAFVTPEDNIINFN
jgi:hypothetical protein